MKTVIILDANILIKERTLSSPRMLKLFRGVELMTPSFILIPSVVVDETTAKLSEFYEEAVRNYRKSISELTTLGKAWSELSPFPEVEDSLPKSFPDQFREQINAKEVKTSGYPDVSHSKIVHRAIQKKRPFGRQGKGYRDYLVWLSVISALKDNQFDRVAFITENVRDFGRGKLYEDFLEDIDCEGIERDRLCYFNSLSHFLERHVEGLLKEYHELEQEVQNGMVCGLDLSSWLKRKIPSVVRENHLAKFRSHFMEDAPIRFLGIGDVESIAPMRIDKIGEYMIIVAGSFCTTIMVGIRASDVPEWEGEEDAEMYYATMSRSAKIKFEVVVDLRSRTLSEPYIHEIT